MNTSNVVTNLRIPQEQYILSKTIASEIGKSFNEYVNDVLKEDAQAKQLGISGESMRVPLKRKRIKYSFGDLSKIAEGTKTDNFELSEDDKIIYGI